MEREAVEVPPEELRLALVLNGGVSLAVWMGGTVREMDALVRADRSGSGLPEGRYAAVLDLARTWASIDVVSGTSAGGVNGALLALSQVNANADLGMLRDLWAEQGQLDNLLRPPFRGQPTSLLQGDEYFLPALTRAMSGLTADFEPTHQDVDLMITTTLLGGALSVTTDGLGQRLPQRRHGERFRFSTSTEMGRTDDFTPERVERTSQAMALAARCTAGFPFAFEPSFVPVHEDASRRSERRRNEPPGVERPDMAEWAGWERSPSSMRVSRDRSRFAMDGGVLANTPTREALDAIDRRPARRPMRRIMVLVYPHAPTFDPDDENADPADDAGRAPTVTDSLSGLLGALTSQGSLTFVEEIEAHNREAARWRGGRLQVLSGFLFEDLYELVRRAWRHYQSTRIRGAARNLADRVPRPDGWPYLRVVETAATGQLHLAGPVRPPPALRPAALAPRGAADLGGRPGPEPALGVGHDGGSGPGRLRGRDPPRGVGRRRTRTGAVLAAAGAGSGVGRQGPDADRARRVRPRVVAPRGTGRGAPRSGLLAAAPDLLPPRHAPRHPRGRGHHAHPGRGAAPGERRGGAGRRPAGPPRRGADRPDGDGRGGSGYGRRGLGRGHRPAGRRRHRARDRRRRDSGAAHPARPMGRRPRPRPARR